MQTSLRHARQALCQAYSHKIISGTNLSQVIRKSIKEKIIEYNEINVAKFYEKPVLGYVIVGNRPDSELYVKLKKKACDEIGIEYQGKNFPETVTEQEIMNEVQTL